MDLTHRIPFPNLDTFQNYFTHPNASILYNDCRMKNNKRVSTSLEQLTKLIPQFNEAENYACFALSRYAMQSASPKVRLDSLRLLLSLSKTSLCVHIVPYILLLTHDDYSQIKTEASTNLTNLLKEVGGLRQCLPQLISAIGSMGHIAFSSASSSNVDEVISNSRLASCVVLSGTQLLSLLFKDIDRRSSAELIQYIKIAIAGVRAALNSPESTEILFYNQRLRSCLYRLQQETEKIKGCPRFVFDDFLKEKDPLCLKYVSALMKSAENIEWRKLVENQILLNEFIDDFLNNSSVDDVAASFKLLSEENTIKVTQFLVQKGQFDLIDFGHVSKLPQIWEKLPEDVVKKAISTGCVVDAKYVIRFSKFFVSSEQIALSSSPEDASDAFLTIGKTSEIPDFVKNFPNSVLATIKKWQKSPKTDWFVPTLQLKKYTTEDADVVSEIIPKDKEGEFADLVNLIITEKLLNDEEVPSQLWHYTELTDKICQLIVEKEIPINTDDEELKKKHYQKIIEIVEKSQPDSNAGAIIGKISSATKVTNFPKTHSYDFLESFFNEFDLKDAPVDLEIEFLNEYLTKEFPNFEITFLMGTFSVERTIESVSKFLKTLTHEKKEQVLKASIEMKLYQVSLFLIATTNEMLDLPKIEFLVPFLIHNPLYSKWVDSFCEDGNRFVKFLKNPDDESLLVTNDHPYFFFASSVSKLYESEYIYDFCSKMVNNASPLYFFLILKSLNNVQILIEKYSEMLLNILSAIASLPSLNSLILSELKKFFCLSANLEKNELFDLLSKCSFNLNSKIVPCLKSSCSLYLSKLDFNDWPLLRQSLSKGPVSSLNVLDELISTKIDINDHEKFSFLIENFPNASSKWFISTGQDESIRERVSKSISNSLVPKLIESTISSIDSNGIEILYDQKERSIRCKFEKDDDSFYLQVKIPSDYPLELPKIEIPSIGKDSVTRETRDEVMREALRPNGLTCAILTWKARIQSIVDNVNPCPICLSLLDERGELPKAKCPTCHQCCHSSCMKQWMSNSTKKVCPWCRALWKVQRHRSKNRGSTSSLGSSSSMDNL